MEKRLKEYLFKLSETKETVLDMLESAYELKDKNHFDSEIKKLKDMILKVEQFIENSEENDKIEARMYLAGSKLEEYFAKFRWIDEVEQKGKMKKKLKIQFCKKKLNLIIEAIEIAEKRLSDINKIGVTSSEMKNRYLLYLSELRLLKDMRIYVTAEIGTLKKKYVRTVELIKSHDSKTFDTLNKFDLDFDHPLWGIVAKREEQENIINNGKIQDLFSFCWEPDRYNNDEDRLNLDEDPGLSQASEEILSDIPTIPNENKKNK